MKKILFSLFATAALLATGTMKSQTVLFEDSFETYADFAITNVGAWTLTDVDNSPTGGFNGITFPNGSGTLKAFQVFNSTTTTPVLTPTATSDWTARTGSKTMTSFYLTSGAANNDWMISPQVQITPGKGASVTFWAKDCDAGYAEKFKVLVSTTGTAVGNFTAVSPEIVTPLDKTWHQYSFNLNAYAGQLIYVAIQCISQDQFGFAVDDFKITDNVLPVAAPNCATLVSPANAATNVPYVSTTLTWTASTTGSPADSYDVYLDKNMNPTTLVGNTTALSYTAPNLDGGSTYYWKIVPKNTIGSATGCAPFSFSTAAPTYCTAGATSTNFEKISNVTFADINNNSTSTAGYEDFTSVVGNVTAGSTYTFSANFTGTSFSADQVLVWIDLNNDKDFNDAGEQVLATTINVAPWTGSITIPSTATTGVTRMRVRMHDTSITPNATPCGVSAFGQVEDYNLNIGTLAVSNADKIQARIYPNPVVDVLNIEATSKVSSVQVFDVSGKAVSSFELNAVKNQIDLSKLTPGVYVVNITTEKGIQSVKIVKK